MKKIMTLLAAAFVATALIACTAPDQNLPNATSNPLVQTVSEPTPAAEKTAEPTPAATATPEPTLAPTPTAKPTVKPTIKPTAKPTAVPAPASTKPDVVSGATKKKK